MSVPYCVHAFGREFLPKLLLTIRPARMRRDGAALVADRDPGDADFAPGLRRLESLYRAAHVRTETFALQPEPARAVVCGLVPGRADPQEEVWALASASAAVWPDHACAVAACVEMARAIETLIRQGALARPRRSIRFLTGYPPFWALSFLRQGRRYQPPLAGVCIDSVGAGPPARADRLQWNATSPMTAGVVDELGAALASRALRLLETGTRLKRRPFAATPETLVADPLRGFPCGRLRIDPGDARRHGRGRRPGPPDSEPGADGWTAAAAALAGTLCFLADAATPEALAWAGHETRRTVRTLHRAGRTLRRAEVEAVVDRHRVWMRSLQRWLWGGERSRILACFADSAEAVRRAAPPLPERKPARPRGAGRIPRRLRSRRLWIEPLDRAGPERRILGVLPPWTIYWADGRRSLAEIAERIAVESGQDVPLATVVDFFERQQARGVVECMEPSVMIGRARLLADLRALGVRPGMDLIVHSSLARIGRVKGGADTVVDALLMAAGKKGTVAMPSFNHLEAYVHHPLTTRTKTGAIADAFWRRPEAVRSLQATHPVAAIGPKADWLCAGHLEAGIWGENSPVGKLIQIGGWILSLGVDHGSSSVYHVAQATVGSPCTDLFGSVNRILMTDGEVAEVPGLASVRKGCPAGVAQTAERLERRGRIRHGRVGQAESMLTRAGDLWREHCRLLRNHCPDCPNRPAPRQTSPVWPEFLREWRK